MTETKPLSEPDLKAMEENSRRAIGFEMDDHNDHLILLLVAELRATKKKLQDLENAITETYQECVLGVREVKP